MSAGDGAVLLWSADAFLAATGGRVDGGAVPPVAGISMDSRTTAPGDAFFAIRGESLDGHRFVAAALAAGAAVAVVAEAFDRGTARGPLLRVDDPLVAMRRLAAAARARSRATIIAVTGSVGKTGTKEALRLALRTGGATHASPASYNNRWGVPFTLAGLPERARYGVFEIGMNHAGEIAPLSVLVRPHIAIITTVEPVHIGHLGSIEAIADAKAEIFEGLEPAGVAILNRDNGQFARLAAAAAAKGARVLGFGAHDHAEARLIRMTGSDAGSTVEADIIGERVAYGLKAPGRHHVINSLAVLAAAKVARADLVLAASALADMAAAKGRGRRVRLAVDGGEAVLIDESYNANPASMRAALDVLGASRPGPRGRRIAVIGDMLELGDETVRYHRELSGPLADAQVDLVYACGPMMSALWETLPSAVRGAYAPCAEALEQAVVDSPRPGDVIMIKGSLGSRMGPLVSALERRYGERIAEPEGN